VCPAGSGMALDEPWWKSLLFLFLANVFWLIPPHPACAIFVSVHGSMMVPGDGNGNGEGCIPSWIHVDL